MLLRQVVSSSDLKGSSLNRIRCFQWTACLLIAAANPLSSQEAPYRYWPKYEKTPLENCAEPPWRTDSGTSIGWDFSLPHDVWVKSNGFLVFSRIFNLNQDPKLPKLSIRANPVLSVWFNWNEVEPEEDKYQFEVLRKVIDKASGMGYGVELRPLTAIASNLNRKDGGRAAPEYLTSKYQVPVLPPEKSRSMIMNLNPEHPAFHERYLKYVRELGRSGILHHPAVKSIVVGYASPSLGDEGIGPKGMQPNQEPEFVKERLSAWAEATTGVAQKVMMCGASEYGFSKGFGARGGFVENYLYRIPSFHIGQFIDEQGYLCVDETSTMLKQGSANGEENEEYEEKWATANGIYGQTTDPFPYRYFVSCLRLLQMRNTIVLLNPFSIMPDLTAYVALQVGRTVQDTPDVWCVLRENVMNATPDLRLDWSTRNIRPADSDGPVRVKNFERWLYQRDAEGYETEAVMKVPMPGRQWMVPKGFEFDWIARAGAKIGFSVDDRFMYGRVQPVTFKITFYDGVKGSWNLVYRNEKGSSTHPMTTTGSDSLRTATFHTTAVFPGKGTAFDFEIHSAEKIPIAMVRVIRRT